MPERTSRQKGNNPTIPSFDPEESKRWRASGSIGKVESKNDCQHGLNPSTIGEKSVWIHGGASGLDKRQCTVQLTLFADGVPRVKPLIIFRRK